MRWVRWNLGLSTKPIRVSMQGPNALNGHTTQEQYLRRLGARVREVRTQRGLTRKFLAAVSGVSERYLAQLEAGEANVSVLLLREIANALGLTAQNLISDPEEREPLNGIPSGGLKIALLGLRGAGKSTVGTLVARKLNVPFIELDRQIEQAAGVEIGMILDLYGQSGFRRLEAQCLEEVFRQHSSFVMATSGSLVSEETTYARLRSDCYTVWLRATPEEHMQRVIEQGDMRPMGHNAQAMDDLKRILADREPLYAKADSVQVTTLRTPAEIASAICQEATQATAIRR